MIISHKYKFVFLHTRKTAGTSIEKALAAHLGPADVCTGSVLDDVPRKNCGPKLKGHISYSKVKEVFGYWDLSEYHWWCVERNSYEKAFSDWWFHLSINSKYTRAEFKEFILKNELSDWSRYYGEGRFQAEVIQYARLHEEWPKFTKSLRLPPIDITQFRYKVAAARPPIHEVYTDDLKKIVANTFRNEIEAFGYEFPQTV